MTGFDWNPQVLSTEDSQDVWKSPHSLSLGSTHMSCHSHMSVRNRLSQISGRILSFAKKRLVRSKKNPRHNTMKTKPHTNPLSSDVYTPQEQEIEVWAFLAIKSSRSECRKYYFGSMES